MTALDAILIGGGVAALASAIALRRSGAGVDVFERAPSLRASGGGLLLWANAMRALRVLGLFDEVLSIGTPVETTEFRSARGELLCSLPVGGLSREHGAPSVIVSRGSLLEVLASALPSASIHTNLRCTGIEVFEDDDVVSALFDDGSARDAELLIGADGISSTVRGLLFGDEPLRETGQVAVVGIASHCEGLMEPGVAVATVGSGLRFWAGPMRGGRVYWYATVKSFHGVSDNPTLAREQLLELFHGFHEPIAALLDATEDAEWIRTPIRDREPSRRWGRGRATLLGDAAHPATPDLGQGACQALESAVVLGECISEIDDVEQALRRYEQRRMARTARMTQMSYVTAMQSMVEGPVLCAARDMGVRLGLLAIAKQELPWVLGGVERGRR